MIAKNEILVLDVLACTLCGWEFLPRKNALVPPLDVITENGDVDLGSVALENHVCCHRCAAATKVGCPEAVFYPMGATQQLIEKLLARKAAAISEETKRQFRLIASRGGAACIMTRPLLEFVRIKTTDKNGNRLMGAAAHNQVRKALKQYAVA